MVETSTPESLDTFFSSTSSLTEEEDDSSLMKYEWNRLNSFKSWPSSCPVFGLRLASAGLYRVGESGNIVRCFACNFTKETWQKGDNPFDIHKNNNSECPFISGYENQCHSVNIPISKDQEEVIPEKFQGIRNLLECNQSLEDPDETALVTTGTLIPLVQTGSAAALPSVNDPLPINSHGNENESPLSRPKIDTSKSTDSPKTSRQDSVKRKGTGSPASSRKQVHSESPGNPVTEVPMASQQITSSRGPSNFVADSPSSSNSQAQQVTLHSSSPKSLISRLSKQQIQQIKPAPMEKDPGLLRFERNRLETFRNWPSGSAVEPRDLARSGFYYTGNDDRVQCVYCRGILKNWDPGDKPHIEHKNKFPRCAFLLGVDVGNVPYSPNQPERGLNHVAVNQRVEVHSSTSMEALGISTDRPKYPNYAVESTRYSSFLSWPQYKHQTPQELAKAGFFYAGFGDNVKCFFCDGGLKNWEPGDVPWIEHARWFPRCPFVKNVKGEQYIKNIQDKYNTEQNGATGQYGNSNVYRIEEREIKARLELPMVRAVLETGLSREVVMHAIRKRLEETGDDFPNAEALMNAALEISDDPAQLSAVTMRQLSPPGEEAAAPENGEDEGPDPEETSLKPSDGTIRGDLSEEVRILKEQKTCKICLDEEVGMVFLPCGHLCCCVNCAPAVQHCPFCRSAIRGTVRTYIP